MPVPATGLAKVLVRDAHPGKGGGLRDYALQELTLSLLDVGSAVELAAYLLQANGKHVSNPLQLTDPEHAGAPGRADGPLDPGAGIRRTEELTQLLLHASDLGAKLLPNRARVALGNSRSGKTTDAGAANAEVRGVRLRNFDLLDQLGHLSSRSENGTNIDSRPTRCRGASQGP
jgi:hypothetical protein